MSVRSVPNPGNAAPHCTRQVSPPQRRFSLYRPAPWAVRSAFLPGWLYLHGGSSQALHLLPAAKGGGAGREASLLPVAPPLTICSGALSEVHHGLAEWRLSQALLTPEPTVRSSRAAPRGRQGSRCGRPVLGAVAPQALLPSRVRSPLEAHFTF